MITAEEMRKLLAAEFGIKTDEELERALKKKGGIRIGIYEHEEFGYFFGIDGCGYDFYEAHWLPLYNKRGLQWHDELAEHRYQMERKGYTVGKIGMNEYWMNGDQVVEEVLKGELGEDDYD